MFEWLKKIRIPKGEYCYSINTIVKDNCKNVPSIKINICPFWNIDKEQPYQMNGYCNFLKQGDWEEDGTLLLWDQVKECGINHYSESELDCT